MNAKSWLKRVAILTAAACLLVAGINYLVDPWGLNGTLVIDGFNANKIDPLGTARLHKAYAVVRLRPSAVAMGTSTAEHGIDMRHPAWREFGTVYNLSFPGATIGEIKAVLQQTHRISPLKRAVIGLDFFSFNAHIAPSPQTGEAIEAMQSLPARIRPYFTRGMLAASFKTLSKQSGASRYFLPSGQSSRDSFVQWRAKSQGHFNLFAFSCRQTVLRLLPNADARFEFQRGSGPSTLEQFGELLEFGKREGIELQFFISPDHAWQDETLSEMGLWPTFEYWKQQLARIIDPYTHAENSAPRMVLWDFADYTAATTEAVPARGDVNAVMRWTWDGQHYTPELGDLIQDRMSGLNSAAGALPDLFGFRLNADNVDAHLLEVREHQQQYRATHATTVAMVQGIVARTLEKRRKKWIE